MRLKATQGNIARTRTDSGLWRVFVYGTLKVGGVKHLCRGDLWIRDTGTGAVDFGGKGWVHGELIEVDDDGLAELDAREGYWKKNPYYRRIIVKTRSNEVCWAYEWARDFRGFSLASDGVWRWEYLRSWRKRYGAHGLNAIARSATKAAAETTRELDEQRDGKQARLPGVSRTPRPRTAADLNALLRASIEARRSKDEEDELDAMDLTKGGETQD